MASAVTAGASQPPAAPALTAVHRYFEVSLFLMLGVAVLTLISTGKLDPISTFVPPLALAIKALRYRRGHAPELSHRAATWLVVGYILFFPFDLWFLSRALAAGAPNPVLYAALLATIHLMLFALVVRLFSARTTRDHLFLALMGFAVMLVSAILTVDTAFLLGFLLFLVLSVSTFVGLEMRRSAEGAVAPPLETGTPMARRLEKALSATSTGVAMSALVLGTLIFFIIPRFTAGYLSGLHLQPSLISGFTDNVELGQIGEIKKNTAVVMRIRVEGGPEQARGVRWRGIALTHFDGRRWFNEDHEPRVVTPGPGLEGWFGVTYGWFYREPGRPARREDWRELARHQGRLSYTVLLEPLASDALFVAAVPMGLRGRFGPESGQFGRPSRRAYLLVDRTGSIRNPLYHFSKILYEGQSLVLEYPPEMLRTSDAAYPPDVLALNLQLPELDPRIPELARQVTANAPTAYDKAVAVELYLRTRFGYTLEQPAPAPEDPLAHFLFERRKGHCEYFAAAMTVMLRALGIPARYVNGFLPGEYNDVGEDFIVRASDAHSWVEAYFPGYGWQTFDPTPPADAPNRSWLGRAALYWDWFELMWSEWVINYDFLHQVTLAQNFQRASREWSERLRRYVQQKRRATVNTLKEWQWMLTRAVRMSPGAAAAIGLLLVLLLAVLFRSRALGEFAALYLGAWGLHLGARGELTPRLATLHYQKMLRLLERRGLPKPPAQTPLEFAASLPPGELGAPVGELTALYQAARFGAQPAKTARMSTLLQAIRNALWPR